VKLHEKEARRRERHGGFVLLEYRWEGAEPEPGQFVVIRPAGVGLDPFLPRPFFVHDFEDGIVSLLVAVRGRGTALIAYSELLFVSEPLGRGFDLEVAGTTALVGGGVWTAPLRFLSRRLDEKGVAPDAFVEAPENAPPGYAALVQERLPGATVVPTADGASGAFLAAMGDLSRYEGVYVSGTEETLRTFGRAGIGRTDAQLAVRARMACANGSCHGCAVPVWREGAKAYVRACVEGPIFRAGDLAW